MGNYRITAATRTTESGVQEGWLVEKKLGAVPVAMSVLFDTQGEAEAELMRLTQLETKTEASERF
jgi:hypothetical protein